MLNDPFDMQFAFQSRVDRDAVIAIALEKGWQHHSGELLDRPINLLGQVIRDFRGRGLNLSREEFVREFEGPILASLDKMKATMEGFCAMVRAHFENDKILCLSDEPDILLMWAYYASNHTGLVLSFRDDTHDNPFAMARPVRYVDQVPSLFDDELLSDMLSGYEALDHRSIMEDVVWTKSNHWAHEREWRIYTGAGRTSASFEDVPFGAEELSGVIFGARVTEDYKKEICELIGGKFPDALLSHAKLRTDAYALTIEPLSH